MKCCFRSSQGSFLLDLSKCNIVKFQQNFKTILSTYLLKYFLFPLQVALCQPVMCRESQGLSAREVLESGSFLLLLLGKVIKIVSVLIKAWLYFIRLNSSWTSCLVLVFSWLLTIKIAASSDVLCFILTRRRCRMI